MAGIGKDGSTPQERAQRRALNHKGLTLDTVADSGVTYRVTAIPNDFEFPHTGSPQYWSMALVRTNDQALHSARVYGNVERVLSEMVRWVSECEQGKLPALKSA